MRIKDPISESDEPFNLVPLTDMVFNLLIFFMAATTFTQIEKDMSLQLPKTSAFRTLSQPPQQLVINIRQDGSTWRPSGPGAGRGRVPGWRGRSE